MNIEQIIGSVATLMAALGGWEAVKYFYNRKTYKRKEEAEADSVEFGLLKETITFLQEQLHERVRQDAEKEKRFVEQTNRLRSVQDEYSSLQKDKSRLELELQKYKCIREKCVDRRPPNGF